jgi:hypothetical protein
MSAAGILVSKTYTFGPKMVLFAVETEPARATPVMAAHRPVAAAGMKAVDMMFLIIAGASG